MKKTFAENLIASCGINCGICKAYLRDKNPCHGCRNANKNIPKTRINCAMRICKKRVGKFCYDCAEFPCEKLSHLDKRYRTKYGMSEIENLLFIKNKGIKKFLACEEKLWISAKGIFCMHDKKYYNKDKEEIYGKK